jgi:hypothetical protein
MTDNQKRERMQLALFKDHLMVPRWHDLNEATREEAVRYLAQLLSRFQHGDLMARSELGRSE